MDSILNTRYPIPKTGAIDDVICAKALLAPMAGISDPPFRTLCRRFGCAFAFTEMIDVNGIVYNNRKTLRMLEKGPGEGPLGVQLVGQDPEKLARVARICEDKGFPVIDLNAGCPARKVIKGGKGAALLRSPKKLGELVRRMVKAVSVPVTVKLRSGWDAESLNYLEVARAAESEGARAVCIHARTKEAMYRGKSDHEVTRELKENLKIPVIASGNIFTAEDAIRVLDETGCDAAAFARGALGRPWIFKEFSALLGSSEPPEGPSFSGLKDIIREHYALSVEFYGEYLAHKRMYKHFAWYLKGCKGLNDVMRVYMKVKTSAMFAEFLEEVALDGRRLFLKQESA